MSEPRAVVLAMLAALNAGDLDAAVAAFALDAENHGRRVGHDGMRAVFEAQRLAFPDWHHEVVQTVVEGSVVVTRSMLSGTHTGRLAGPMASRLFGGALEGLEPEGRRVEIQAIHVWEVEGDRIVRHWATRDDLGMRRQAAGTS